MIKIDHILSSPEIIGIINEPTFYFQKGQDVLQSWLALEVSIPLQEQLPSLAKDYKTLQVEAERDIELQGVLETLFKVVSYCDNHAKDKQLYNEYVNKRVLAKATVRMNNWIEKLIQLKYSPSEVGNGSPKNAFDYLLNPEMNATILSEKHRELVAQNLFKKTYVVDQFVEQLKEFYAPYGLTTTNPLNFTHLLSRITSSIQSEWKEEVIGLMASDNTGWQEDYIKKIEGNEALVLWNSKKPSGTSDTLKQLRSIINDGATFNLYYSFKSMVHYKATIIDFAESQYELDSRDWDNNLKIFHYSPQFAEYADDNKSAAIVFLASTLEKIKPVSVANFKFYKNYEAPRQDNLQPVKLEPENITVIPVFSKPPKSKSVNPPLNLILYGPPGTGKTYHTINRAIKIANPAFDLVFKKRDDIKAEYKRLKMAGQIEFVTFHQSMSYEDFIEGIKPVKPEKSNEIQYEIVNGIFKNICLEASRTIELFVTIEGIKKTLTRELFEEFYYVFSESLPLHVKDTSPVILKTKEGSPFELFQNSARSIVVRAGEKKTNQSVALSELVEVLFSNKQPTYRSYENIIINKILEDKNFKQSNVDNTKKAYVLIIDEINRGNVSQVFGELITLIEDDKRGGSKEEIEVILPYSKTSFKVPPNVFIIGTMNTADRSVEALDTALRRRFVFEEMAPDPKLLCPFNALKNSWLTHWNMPSNEFENIFLPNFEREYNVSVDLDVHRALEAEYMSTTTEDWITMEGSEVFKKAIKIPDDRLDGLQLLSTINNRLLALLDKDHLIGHAWIMGAITMEDMRLAFKNKILPLLQEYFYNNYAKIGLILGEAFFEKPVKISKGLFARFDGSEDISEDYNDKMIYRFKDPLLLTIEDFKSIYQSASLSL